ncbi:MAG TPA: phytase [Bacteroidales bacterium]|nr:phytase [Bacteroidales bacterium]
MKRIALPFLLIAAGLSMCFIMQTTSEPIVVSPVIVSDTTLNDTDDPAIWYNKQNPSKSLILGTDKGDSTGGIFVFDLQGKLQKHLCIYNLQRPNNIDIEYGFVYNKKVIDIAVFTERGTDKIRVISLPDCKFIDNGGIPIFADDTLRSPMGIALYKNKQQEIFAFVGRKTGPKEGYIYQYKLTSTKQGLNAQKIRAVGLYSGIKEIEAIAVDDELGYLYYSDEKFGIRKYYADADKGNKELAVFGTSGFTSDQEGISIYTQPNGEGYIIVSDQQANQFHVFSRKGTVSNEHEHKLVHIVKTKTDESDGSDLCSLPLNATFTQGIFVAMSSDKTFQFYKLEDIVPIKK